MDHTLLVREAQDGNYQAFEELVRYYDRGILRLILHLTGSQRDAREIYRKAFLRAYRELGHFQFETDFSIWIYRLATSLCMDELRRGKRRNGDARRVRGGNP